MKQLFNKQIGDWIPKSEAMEFLGYKSTQMNEFIKYYTNLRVSRIGRRTFIHVPSLIKVIEINEER
jgi:ribonucleotide reductase beta subunit family protein with ferritin-like domain